MLLGMAIALSRHTENKQIVLRGVGCSVFPRENEKQIMAYGVALIQNSS